MKKIGQIVLSFIFLISIATSVNATLFSSTSHSYSSGSPIWTVSTKTPNGEPILLDGMEVFIGMSTSNPCGDLTSIVTINNVWMETETTSLSSEDFEDFSSGDIRVTCMRMDMFTHNKTYTTGNLKLIWDDSLKKYVGVEPSHTYIDFTS